VFCSQRPRAQAAVRIKADFRAILARDHGRVNRRSPVRPADAARAAGLPRRAPTGRWPCGSRR